MTYLRIHAASIVVGEAALMLCGPNGAGKTTLTLRFIAEGARVLSDDEAWIHPLTTLIHPSERPLVVKQSGLHHFPHYASLATCFEDHGEIVWVIDPRSIRDDLRGVPSPCRAIITLEPGDGPADLRPASQRDTFKKLLQQCMNFPDLGPRAVTLLSRLIQNSVLYELRRGCLEESVELIKEKVLCRISPSTTTIT